MSLHFLCALIFFNFFLASSFASDYPPGYAITRTCQTQGPFEACIINQNQGTYPRIKVIYRGYLIHSSLQEINVSIKENQSPLVFKALSGQLGSPQELTFNDPKPAKCWTKPYGSAPDASIPPLSGEYSWCKKLVQSSQASDPLVWETLELDPVESKLISEILRAPQVRFELAAFNREGQWDSQMGKNYHFAF